MTQEQFERAGSIINQLRGWKLFRDNLQGGIIGINGITLSSVGLSQLDRGALYRAADEIMEAVNDKINELNKQLSEI